MRLITHLGLLLFVAPGAWGQSSDPPIDDSQLSIHTLVREDIFAGWRANNMERFERGEKNVDLLLEKRPQAKADLLAWKGAAKLFRAVLALEAGDRESFDTDYEEARDLFAASRKLGPDSVGSAAVVGGTYVTFADRLPEELQQAAWDACYDNYQALWKMQGRYVDRLPLHMQGELLGGLAQAAQRTGRAEEMDSYLDQILTSIPDSAYARVARQWKDDPELAGTTAISCKSCHNPGRLAAVRAASNQ